MPVLERAIVASDGSAVSLVGATAKFIYAPTAGGAGVIGTGTTTITDAAAGEVQYAWSAADTLVAGEYNGEFEVVIGGLRLTSPNSSYLVFVVFPDLGDAP